MVRELFQLNTFHKRAIVVLIGVVFAFLTVYGALVRQTVAHVVARKVIEQSITDTAGDVALLEATYMETVDSLTLARAYDLGFVESDVSLFVSRRAHTLSLRDDNE